MKKIIILICILNSALTHGQNNNAQNIKLGWAIASPAILNNIKDQLTKEIVTNAIPKMIDQDIEGAATEVTNAISRVNNIKVLNTQFISELKTNLTTGINAIQQNDYYTAVNGLISVKSLTDSYIKLGTLDKHETNTHAPVVANKTPETFYGIGIHDKIVNDTIKVTSVIPGTPSEKAGMQSGDCIVKIDGQNVCGIGITMEQAINKIRGPEGSIVEVSVYRNGAPNLIDLTMVRQKFTVTSPQNTNTSNPQKEECEVNKNGNLIVTNISNNPYDIYADNVLLIRLSGKSKSNKIAINEGNNRKLYAKQVSGFAMYPTERTKLFTIIKCSDYNWQIP